MRVGLRKGVAQRSQISSTVYILIRRMSGTCEPPSAIYGESAHMYRTLSANIERQAEKHRPKCAGRAVSSPCDGPLSR